MLKSDLVRDCPLSWHVRSGLMISTVTYYVPCKLTGHLDRTVTGHLQNGNSVEIMIAGGYPIWVLPGDIFDKHGKPLGEASILMLAKDASEYTP
jgi:hypothetical protein